MRWIKYVALALLLLIVGAIAWFWTPDTDRVAMRAKYANAASRFVDVGGGLTMHLRDEGPRGAPILVLLHGSNASLHTWDAWADRLKERYRIVRVDQIGHGLTGPHPTGRYDDAAYVDTLDAALTRLGVDRFVLGGNSMGGGVAWKYALAHPGKVAGLILIDATGAPDNRPDSLPVGMWLAQTPGVATLMTKLTPRSLIASSLPSALSNQAIVDDAMIDRYWELLRYPGNREATVRQALFENVAATPVAMKRLTMPALLLWGAEDKLVPLADGQWFARALPNARLIAYPDIGHIPMEETPDRSARDVRAWLDTLAKPATSR